MKITAKTVWKSPGRLEVEVTAGEEKKKLYFESDRPLWPAPPETDNFAAVALCQYASGLGADLYVDGDLTESVICNLEEYTRIWANWMPEKFSPVRIEARNTIKDKPHRKKPAVMAFSGGVDACFALAMHNTDFLGANAKDIQMGILIVGFDIKRDHESTKRLAYKNAKHILGEFGADCATVETNWQDRFCRDWEMGYDVGVLSILHSLAGEYSAGVIANANSYFQELQRDPFGCNATTNHLLGSYTFPIVLTGGTHTRLERIEFLGRFPALMDRVRVCWQPLSEGINCGVCEKCVRTRLEMISCGLNPDIFNESMSEKHIEALTIQNRVQFMFFEEVYLNFPKQNPYYASVEKVYRAAKERNDPCGARLAEQDIAVRRLQDEIKKIQSTKSYKAAAPLRAVRGFFKGKEKAGN